MSIETIRYVKTSARAVAITFDDGPHTIYTPRVLESLQKYNSHATWFILGKLAQSRQPILKDIAQGDNDIGVHAYDHVSLTTLSYNQIVSQLERTKAIIVEATGRSWPYLRPPNGAYNEMVLKAAGSIGFEYNVLWSVDPRDYESSATQITTRVLTSLSPGAIIILHEVTSPTAQALPVILSEMDNRGYQAVTFSRLLELADA
ncbi:MAG: polysaccharide deacetylase family protein [Syntrophomonadaceae bacterium]